MNERDRAMRALSAWRAERPWARRDPAELDVVDVVPCGPTQAILESIYEARGVRYALRPAPTRPETNEDGPDPWSVALEHHHPPRPGAEVSAPLEGRTVHMDCGVCSSQGELTCPHCNGNGRVSAGGNRTRPCPRCGGRTVITCNQCQGSGGLLGAPTVWSRIEQQKRLRVHEPEELPVDVFLDLQDTDHGGEVIHEQEAERVVDLKREGGYRDAASSADPLRQLVQDVGVDHGVPEGGRIIEQRLEIRQVPAWQVKLSSDRSVWVYGEPPKVWPMQPMSTWTVRAARVAPYFAAAVAFLVAAIWLTSG